MSKCAIALGSNLGESLNILENAISSLINIQGIDLITRSSWYQTKPIGPPQPDYINGCIIIETNLNPEELLVKLLEIEQEFGRIRRIRWDARSLDLDIIFYENLIINTPQLEIPHPRMRERAFVLVPLTEIAPDWIDPITNLTIAQLLEKIDIVGVNKLH